MHRSVVSQRRGVRAHAKRRPPISSCARMLVGKLAMGFVRVARMARAECSAVTLKGATLTGRRSLDNQRSRGTEYSLIRVMRMIPCPREGRCGVSYRRSLACSTVFCSRQSFPARYGICFFLGRMLVERLIPVHIVWLSQYIGA